jgi:hypothetical protein
MLCEVAEEILAPKEGFDPKSAHSPKKLTMKALTFDGALSCLFQAPSREHLWSWAGAATTVIFPGEHLETNSPRRFFETINGNPQSLQPNNPRGHP